VLVKDEHHATAAYEYVPADATKELEHRLEAHARDTNAKLDLITSALIRIEKALEARALHTEDAHARIDRVEANDLETRRQIAALQPKKKATRKK
jgi:hypothetical protein